MPATKAERDRWYAKDHEAQKQRVKLRKIELKEWVTAQKVMRGCASCNEIHPACLEFHHINPATKLVNVSQAVDRKGWAKKRLQEEIDKCIVLCANCHRKAHWPLESDG